MRTAKTLLGFILLTLSTNAQADSLTQYVNPFIGTKPGAPGYIINNSNGNVFPGAVFPNGMVQFSPDTPEGNAGGYLYDSNIIKGFSLTHFSGRGISCWMDFPIMPTAGPVSGQGRKFSTFSHENEKASPGYYKVRLDDAGITAELTSTARTGFARFTFPSSTEPVVQIDSQGQASSDKGGTLQILSEDTVTGVTNGRGCGGKGITYKLYFYAKFDRPFVHHENWKKSLGTNLVFKAPPNGVIQMKIGISFVDLEGAKANLLAENPGWNFEDIRVKADLAWENRLSRIKVEGGARDEKVVFYTSLYHSFIHPNIFSDADGRYLGFDDRIHQVSKGRDQYENFAAWDNYRTLMPLLAVTSPKQAADMMQSLVNMAEEDRAVRPKGGGLPRWQQANQNSCGMEGDDQAAAIASVNALGIWDFDVYKAFEAMERGASVVGTTSGCCKVRPGLSDWLSKGYVPLQGSLNLEYANSDFAIGQMAFALKAFDKHSLYSSRSRNWQKIFDTSQKNGGYFVPRKAFGSFFLRFPLLCGVFCEFDEGNSMQYTWLLPFDYDKLFELMGGPDRAIDRLDAHFYGPKGKPMLNEGPNSPYAFLGNEPESVAPYAYVFAGAPDLAAKVLREMISGYYKNAPDGMPGNDDGGAMGSWVVWSMLGLRPVISGSEEISLTGPMFDSITLALKDGKSLRVRAIRKTPNSNDLEKVTFNREKISKTEILWSELAKGGNLGFHYR